MKKIIASLLLAITVSIIPASAGEKSFGVLGGYNTRTESAVAGLWFHYSMVKYCRVAPDIQYMFRNHGNEAFAFNCNLHVPLSVGPGGYVGLYPLAGINYTSWNFRDAVVLRARELPDANASARYNRFGFNIGGGLEFKVSSTLKVTIEGKATLMKDYTCGTFTAGVGYIF